MSDGYRRTVATVYEARAPSQRRLAAWVALVFIGVARLAVPAVAVAMPGYERVAVKVAGISFVLPDEWQRNSMTRRQAKRILDDNPALAATGQTVEGLLSVPFWAGPYDEHGDHADRSISVQIYPGVTSWGTASLVQAALAAREYFANVTVEPVTVGRDIPALCARYTNEWTRDGASATHTVQTYLFVSSKGRVQMQFASEPDDRGFESAVNASVTSIRLLR